MGNLQIGDIVVRKSYGGDIYFTIADIVQRDGEQPVYVIKGLLYRIYADSDGDDLVKQDPRQVYRHMARYLTGVTRQAFRTNAFRGVFSRPRTKLGTILHIDAASDYLQRCMDYYRESGLRPVGVVADESEQPRVVQRLLEQNRPDILVLTGHDALKKNADRFNLNESYVNSKHFVQAVKTAREYEGDADKLCIFAGACQSYYEAIMAAGANFASSPGRILINALDPAIVSNKVALTDSGSFVTPGEIAELTVSGSRGIGGINTRGQAENV